LIGTSTEDDSMRTVAVLVAVCVLGLAPQAAAEPNPSKPIRVIIPASAGGTQDVFMRALGEDLRKRFGRTLTIENRPGDHFNVGARACAEAPPDGNTICMLPNEALVYNQFLFKKLPYDPVKNFAPITNPFFSTQAIVANADLKVKSLAELAALSKAKPKSLTYIAPGLPLWVFMENFKKRTGADMTRAPFRGGGETVKGVLAGTTPVAFSGLSNWASYLQAGTIVGLAVDSPRRLPMIPDVPTIGELGYKIDITRIYFGIVAPAGTPRPVLERLRNEMAEVINDVDFREQHLTSRGHEPVANTPDQFARFLTLDRLLSARIVKDAGVQPQ
jgi:tripartite-type tricarboxylate transporter receptor subunit TctC